MRAAELNFAFELKMFHGFGWLRLSPMLAKLAQVGPFCQPLANLAKMGVLWPTWRRPASSKASPFQILRAVSRP